MTLENTHETVTPKAYFVKNLRLNEYGHVALYRLSEPLNGYDYVVVSAIQVGHTTETYIFPGEEAGWGLSRDELPGSASGIFDHETALENAGYELV